MRNQPLKAAALLDALSAPFATAHAKTAALLSPPLAITSLTVADELIRDAAGIASLAVSIVALWPIVSGWCRKRFRRRR
jgi:hypothetical protein